MTQYGRRDFLLALGVGATAASVAKVSEVQPLSQPPLPDADEWRSALETFASQREYSDNCFIRIRRTYWYSNGHSYTITKTGRRASKKRLVTA
jgi:hypothetical protein